MRELRNSGKMRPLLGPHQGQGKERKKGEKKSAPIAQWEFNIERKPITPERGKREE